MDVAKERADTVAAIKEVLGRKDINYIICSARLEDGSTKTLRFATPDFDAWVAMQLIRGNV